MVFYLVFLLPGRIELFLSGGVGDMVVNVSPRAEPFWVFFKSKEDGNDSKFISSV